MVVALENLEHEDVYDQDMEKDDHKDEDHKKDHDAVLHWSRQGKPS